MAKDRPAIAVQLYSANEHLQTVPDFENTLRRLRAARLRVPGGAGLGSD